MSDLRFAVIGENGMYVKPMPISCEEIRLEPADDSFDVTGIRNGFSGSMSATLVSVDHEAIRDLFGDARQPTYDIAFECSITKGLYRHDRVWRYRMERKGDKSNRRRRRRKSVSSVSSVRRTVLHNATVRVEDKLSDGVLPRYDITFDQKRASPCL